VLKAPAAPGRPDLTSAPSPTGCSGRALPLSAPAFAEQQHRETALEFVQGALLPASFRRSALSRR
jgi:hypothetical protein